MPSHSCYECALFVRPALDSPDHGIRGKCALAKKKWNGDVTVGWTAPACRGFESKAPKYKAGRRR